MKAEGRTYKGCLYAGLMVCGDEVKVVEFNCRFGDPETQVVLPLLDGDLAEIMLACATGGLDKVNIGWHDKAAVCVVLASGGYPEVVTAGGRVLGVTAVGKDIADAQERAYKAASVISFKDMQYRKDIAWRALKK